MNIRTFVVRATHLDDLVQLGTLSVQAARFLEAAVSSGLNILVAGGTQVGKATNRQDTLTAGCATRMASNTLMHDGGGCHHGEHGA